MHTAVNQHPRGAVYYWKADRPAALSRANPVAVETIRPGLEIMLREAVERNFSHPIARLKLANGQGNHITYRMTIDQVEYFIRVEDGPERDDYMEIETRVIAEVSTTGVPTPEIHYVDSGRQDVPFAWQVLECIPDPDLNQLYKQGLLDLKELGIEIGESIGKWQTITAPGFGLFQIDVLRREGLLCGYHHTYADYFHLHLARHLAYLEQERFITSALAHEIGNEIERHSSLLKLTQGCLVHKDLALWNIMGSAKHIAAFIDWDDAISGDAMDDISLLGCFHGGELLGRVLTGYAKIRPLPQDFQLRFWLHLLRNMLVKAVIRVGSGYFDRKDNFFLIGPGTSGITLREFTLQRIQTALAGLRSDAEITTL